MGTRAPMGEMIRIEVADLARELRTTLAGRTGRGGDHREPDTTPRAASDGDRTSRGERRLRLVVTPDERSMPDECSGSER